MSNEGQAWQAYRRSKILHYMNDLAASIEVALEEIGVWDDKVEARLDELLGSAKARALKEIP